MGELRSNTDMIDVSRGGMFGGPLDHERTFVEGARHFYHGETEIGEAEFERLRPTHVIATELSEAAFARIEEKLAAAKRLGDWSVENWFRMEDVEALVWEVRRLRGQES